jgi:hypothetical protein
VIDFEVVAAVTPHLILSPGPASLADMDELYLAGVRWIIDCRAEFDDAPLLASHPDVAYMWNPTADDGMAKPPEWFERGYRFAEPYLLAKQSGDPHCAAEVNRGPSMAYYVLRRFWHMDGPTAEKAIRDVRPQVGIRYKADADAAYEVHKADG